MNDPMVTECYQILGHFWYIIEKQDDGYCYGLVDFLETEFGYFTIEELEANGAVKDPCFQPQPVSQVMKRIEIIHFMEGIA